MKETIVLSVLNAALPTIETAAGPPSRSLCGAPFSTTVPSHASRAVVRSAMFLVSFAVLLVFFSRRGALLGAAARFYALRGVPVFLTATASVS